MDQQFSSVQSPTPAPSGTDNQRVMAIASLVIGILNLCSWFFYYPCGILLGIIGVVLGVLGMKSPSLKTLALFGIVLSVIGLLLAMGIGILRLLAPSIGNVFSSINQSLAP